MVYLGGGLCAVRSVGNQPCIFNQKLMNMLLGTIRRNHPYSLPENDIISLVDRLSGAHTLSALVLPVKLFFFVRSLYSMSCVIMVVVRGKLGRRQILGEVYSSVSQRFDTSGWNYVKTYVYVFKMDLKAFFGCLLKLRLHFYYKLKTTKFYLY